jgi:hypothetical protein
MEKKTDNIIAKRTRRNRLHLLLSSIWSVCFSLFSWLLYYLSFSPCSLDYYIICLFLLVLLAIILAVSFSLFSWLLYYLSFSPCSLGYYIICLFLLVLLAIILSVFFSLFSWLLYYLSFSLCSLGYYIIFLFLFVLFYNSQENKEKQTDNIITKRTRRKRQII